MGEAPKRGIEVLEIVDRAIEHGVLAARPAAEACEWCDFQVGVRPRRRAPHPPQGPRSSSPISMR